MSIHQPALAGRAGLKPNQAWALLALSILLLGLNWPVLKIGLRSIPPLWFSDVRLFGAAIVYAVPLALTGRLILPPRSEIKIIVGLGICQGAAMMGLITIGLQTVGAGRSAILVYTTPLWVIPGAMIFLGERITRMQLAGLLCGLAGIAILFNPLDFDWSNGPVIVGNLYCLASALVWSVALLQVRGHRWQADPIQLMPYQSLLGGVLLLPFAIAAEGWPPKIAWSGEFTLAFSYTVILATALGFWTLVAAARRLPAIGVSLAQLATPVIGVASAEIWIGEVPTRGDLVGLGLIILGVAIASAFGRPKGA